MIVPKWHLLFIPVILFLCAAPHQHIITRVAACELGAIKRMLAWQFEPREWPIGGLESKNVHYENILPIRGLSCGLEILINAALIESREGISQMHSRIEPFIAKVKPIIEAQGYRSNQGLPLSLISRLASELMLQPMTLLWIDENKSIRRWITDSPESALCDDSYFDNLKKLLADHTKYPIVLHFGCNVLSDNIEHIILISVVKDAAGLITCYVRDNMNYMITAQSQARQYLDFIMSHFISTR
jgi:hypothetical protein